jgi:hypothetical protein
MFILPHLLLVRLLLIMVLLPQTTTITITITITKSQVRMKGIVMMGIAVIEWMGIALTLIGSKAS